MENTQVNTPENGKELVENRKNRRLFILFLVIDVILLGLIAYEIFALIKNGIDAKNASTTAINIIEQIKNLI